ncbi:RNA polymerase sigma factor [Tunicatimonas pelagia]|uniref:RNA polymerase sigma factor n=1 Tax=Tunicatimonas pelagia TaxID=931531 RepID=UPI00266588FE|nr:RNA polymerase sigma factor [Tunicatimonas pelagia]WKN41768.1 RNA polymerase sigma factor [Tunicatimonas pelagia]
MTVRHSANHPISDEEVIRKITEHKDTAAFGRLYDRYADKVFAKCVSFTHDRAEAEDLAHDVFLKVYLKLSEFRFQAKFSTWLYSITYHECVEYARKNKKAMKEQEAYSSEQTHQIDEAESEAALLELRINQLKRLLEKISPEERALLLMKYQDGASVEEIMAHTQLGESAVKMRLKRAKEKVISLSRARAIVILFILLLSWLLIL